jgi:hypothetical protein
MKNSILILLMFLSSCGTETGNPIIDNLTGSPAQDDSTNISSYSSSLVGTICTKLVSCHSSFLTLDNCLVGTKVQSNLDTELGLTDGDYSTYQDIIDAESNSSLTTNNTEAIQCLADISIFTCSDANVLNAFNAGSPTDFSNVYKIIPTGAGSCNDFF